MGNNYNKSTMKREFIKIDFSEVSKLDDDSLHVLIGGTTSAGPGKILKEILDIIGIEINKNCGCTIRNGRC